MTVSPRRLGAAFFVSAFIILALAATVLWFAMPVKVQAQSHERGMSAIYGDPV